MLVPMTLSPTTPPTRSRGVRMAPGSPLAAALGTASTAARNAWAISPFGEGVEEYAALPATVLYDEPHRQLRRYDRSSPATATRPVLLVPPLAVAAACYDLRPGQSLAAHLIGTGRQPYVIDYGDITFADRAMGFEDWIDDILPTAITAVSTAHGGAPVDVVGWSLGGTMSLLTAAAHPRLPIATLTALGTPIDYRLIPMTTALRTADRLLGTRVVTAATAVMGGVPRQVVRASFRATAPRRELTKAFYLARNILDTEALARTAAIDDFVATMPGYPGRAYHQIHSRLMTRLELVSGTVNLSRSRAVRLADIRTRVLLVGSRSDAIAPAAAVEAGVRSIPGAQFAAADGLSHLGLIAGPTAARISWPLMDAFLDS